VRLFDFHLLERGTITMVGIRKNGRKVRAWRFDLTMNRPDRHESAPCLKRNDALSPPGNSRPDSGSFLFF
jgi:hypothetical protein